MKFQSEKMGTVEGNLTHWVYSHCILGKESIKRLK